MKTICETCNSQLAWVTQNAYVHAASIKLQQIENGTHIHFVLTVPTMPNNVSVSTAELMKPYIELFPTATVSYPLQRRHVAVFDIDADHSSFIAILNELHKLASREITPYQENMVDDCCRARRASER